MGSLKMLAAALALAGAANVHSQSFGPTSTFSGLTWSVSTSAPGLQSCTQLFLDATGDTQYSDHYSMYGQLYCPALAGGYASYGSAYFDTGNAFHMTVTFGITYQLVCDYLNGSTLSGSCPVYDNLGAQVGSAFVSFQ